MEVLYLLIPLALLLVSIIVGAFWWATHSNQFDDLEGPAYRILMDDAPRKRREKDEAADQEDNDPGRARTPPE